MRPSAKDVRKAASIFYRLPRAELCGDGRERKVAYPRHVAMAVCRQMTVASLPAIGLVFGGRDHTTVMHAMEGVAERALAEPAAMDRELDGVALLSARICLDRIARERAWVMEAIATGQIRHRFEMLEAAE